MAELDYMIRKRFNGLGDWRLWHKCIDTEIHSWYLRLQCRLPKINLGINDYLDTIYELNIH